MPPWARWPLVAGGAAGVQGWDVAHATPGPPSGVRMRREPPSGGPLRVLRPTTELLVVLEDAVRLRTGYLERGLRGRLLRDDRGDRVLDDRPDVLLPADVRLWLARAVEVEGLLALRVGLRPGVLQRRVVRRGFADRHVRRRDGPLRRLLRVGEPL